MNNVVNVWNVNNVVNVWNVNNVVNVWNVNNVVNVWNVINPRTPGYRNTYKKHFLLLICNNIYLKWKNKIKKIV